VTRSSPTDFNRAPRRRLVAGCGALGMRVARRWLAAGDAVWGTTRCRHEQLAEAGIVPITVDLGSDPLPPMPKVDTVFWAVGFDRRSGITPHDLHVRGFGRLLDAISQPVRVILSSSTGVWGEGDGEIVTEQTPVCPTRPSAVALVKAEELLRSHEKGPGVALRFAGLYGPERLPRLDDLRAGREIAADPASWLNLIHLDDAAAVVCWAADEAAVAPLYIVADGNPLQRGEWYSRLAEITKSPPPRFTRPAASARGANKRADASLLLSRLSHQLAYPQALTAVEKIVGSFLPGSRSLHRS
jgi:nucleoside-diphosphate-sugar epimerase